MFSKLQDKYEIKSNRESGAGRPDILLRAKDKNDYSAVIEIKADASKKAVEEAMCQIEEKEYVQELISEGYTRILKVALGVDGKNVQALVRE
jgi:folate-dependent phosphoribosylglycinamide formyltransferase PurN